MFANLIVSSHKIDLTNSSNADEFLSRMKYAPAIDIITSIALLGLGIFGTHFGMSTTACNLLLGAGIAYGTWTAFLTAVFQRIINNPFAKTVAPDGKWVKGTTVAISGALLLIGFLGLYLHIPNMPSSVSLGMIGAGGAGFVILAGNILSHYLLQRNAKAQEPIKMERHPNAAEASDFVPDVQEPVAQAPKLVTQPNFERAVSRERAMSDTQPKSEKAVAKKRAMSAT